MKKNSEAEERAVVMIEHGKNTSATAIARILERATPTVTREFKRNAKAPGGAMTPRGRPRHTGRGVSIACVRASWPLTVRSIGACMTTWSTGAGRRSRLGWDTPEEAMAKELEKAELVNVSLDS